MKKRLSLFGQLVLLWMGFFIVGRVLFMLYQFALTRQLIITDIIIPNLLGLRMDAAMTGYWLVLPGLALVLSFILPKIAKAVIATTFYLFLVLSAVIIVFDLELYAIGVSAWTQHPCFTQALKGLAQYQ
jgi:hypothetical protein